MMQIGSTERFSLKNVCPTRTYANKGMEAPLVLTEEYRDLLPNNLTVGGKRE